MTAKARFRKSRYAAQLLAAIGVALMAGAAPAQSSPQSWLTSSDHASIMAPVPPGPVPAGATPIRIDASRRYQRIDGFGFTLTGGSALLLARMSPAARHALLADLFGRGAGGLGISWLRVSIGSSDMDDHVFTYDDLPPGAADPALARFSLAPDERALIPVLREILAIRPGLPILASPWSMPGWMKTNGAAKGGMLRDDMGDVFARYLVAYLRGMAAHGIPIAAITLQNEPENANNTPSMLMSATQQAALIADHVGPALRAAGLPTRIITFDHNADHPAYPLAVLVDARAAAFVAGTGFHLYQGDASALAQVHDAHPDKPVWLTEQMVIDDPRTGRPTPVAGPTARVIIASLTHWAQGVLLWNLAADPAFGPHTGNGGCPVCEGAVTLDGNRVTRNVALAAIAPFARLVPPGSTRIGIVSPDPNLPSVAFRTPAGDDVLVVANPGSTDRSVGLADGDRLFGGRVPAGAVLTVRWARAQ